MKWERDGRACTKNVKHLWGETWTWEKEAPGRRGVSERDHAPFSASTPHAPFPKMVFNLGCFSKDSFFFKIRLLPVLCFHTVVTCQCRQPSLGQPLLLGSTASPEDGDATRFTRPSTCPEPRPGFGSRGVRAVLGSHCWSEAGPGLGFRPTASFPETLLPLSGD